MIGDFPTLVHPRSRSTLPPQKKERVIVYRGPNFLGRSPDAASTDDVLHAMMNLLARNVNEIDMCNQQRERQPPIQERQHRRILVMLQQYQDPTRLKPHLNSHWCFARHPPLPAMLPSTKRCKTWIKSPQPQPTWVMQKPNFLPTFPTERPHSIHTHPPIKGPAKARK